MTSLVSQTEDYAVYNVKTATIFLLLPPSKKKNRPTERWFSTTRLPNHLSNFFPCEHNFFFIDTTLSKKNFKAVSGSV